jgi:hypothetical protein
MPRVVRFLYVLFGGGAILVLNGFVFGMSKGPLPILWGDAAFFADRAILRHSASLLFVPILAMAISLVIAWIMRLGVRGTEVVLWTLVAGADIALCFSDTARGIAGVWWYSPLFSVWAFFLTLNLLNVFFMTSRKR